MKRKANPRQLNVTVSQLFNMKPGKTEENDRNLQVLLQVEDLQVGTRFIRGTLSPEFNESFSVVITTDAPPILVLSVIHKDDPSNPESKEENLGVVKVKLGLMENRPMRDVKYNLEKKVIWSEEAVQGEMRVLIEYTGEISMNPEDTPFKKMEKMPAATGKLLEFYLKEIDKLRGNEKELEGRVRDRNNKIANLEKERVKLQDALTQMEDGQRVLDRLKELDLERADIEDKYRKLTSEVEDRDATIARQEKRIMLLEKNADQNLRMVKRMTTTMTMSTAAAANAAALLAAQEAEEKATPEDTAAALDQLSLSLEAEPATEEPKDDAESEDDEELGGQPDEDVKDDKDEEINKLKKRFEKELNAKNEWKSKYEDMEALYNEIVLHRQLQMKELEDARSREASQSQQKNFEEISRLREDITKSREEIDQLKMEIKLTESQLDDAMKKYRKEAKERKKLYNEIQELKGNIRVYCRCRPLSNAEMERGASDATAFGDLDDITIFSENGQKKTFEFDRTFDQTSTQEKVFEDTLPLMQSVLDGYNVCIFAYGQTGSGKTFTMQGNQAHPGVNVRALTNLFDLVADKGDDYIFEMSISIFEIYCDQIRDLLISNSAPLSIRQEKRDGRVHNYIDGISQRVVGSVDDVQNTILIANDNRSTASTNMNEYSSRSHLIMTVDVCTIDKLSNKRTQASLHMIDLAGSERVGRSGVQGQALKEAQFINQSLAALGNTLSALGRKDNHVPYRDSKLTHALADALGGNSKVLMFCNVSPSSDNVQETLSSLAFATRARAVELGKATANVSKPAAGDDAPDGEEDVDGGDKEAAPAKKPAAPAKPTISKLPTKPAAPAKPSLTKTAAPAKAAAPAPSPRAAPSPRVAPSPRTTTAAPAAAAAAAKKPIGGLRK